MGIIKMIIGGALFLGGIIVFIFGLYQFATTLLGFNSEIAFAGAIAGIGFVAMLVGAVATFLGKLILK